MKMILFLKKERGFFKTELEYCLAASILFSIALAITASIFRGRTIFVFLTWNLFLAFVPYVISSFMQQNIGRKKNRLMFCVLFIAWVLFIPNSFYIITDLFHLGSFDNIPLWYELAMILSFAWNGLLLGILSVRQMERMLEQQLGKQTEVFFIYPLMFLNALGVYIGRYMRFNSWDVITSPFHLVRDIARFVMHPIQNKYDWGMVICFSIFMTLMYITVKRLSNDRNFLNTNLRELKRMDANG
jgi:uncharacterized membrane protein